MTTGIVHAYSCAHCGELFEEPGGLLYECSRCGNNFVEDDIEDRRCPECHIFMAKLAEESCPECLEPDPITVEAWRGSDGRLYSSKDEEARWIADAPERERKRVEHEEWEKRYFAEQHAKNLADNAILAPKIKLLLEILDGRMPTLERSLAWELGNIERHPEDRAGLTAMLYFYELAAVVAPEMGEELEIARDYLGRSDVERDVAEEKIRPLIVEAFGKSSFVDRMRDGWFKAGSGIGVPVFEAVEALLAVLDKEG